LQHIAWHLHLQNQKNPCPPMIDVEDAGIAAFEMTALL
jgi:hypothetical protein